MRFRTSLIMNQIVKKIDLMTKIIVSIGREKR